MDYNEFIMDGTVLESYQGKEANVVIPEGVTEIGNYAFLENEDIRSVIIPSSCTQIGTEAFCGCSILSRVEVNGELEIGSSAFVNTPWFRQQHGPVILGGCLLGYNGEDVIENLDIPEGVTNIASGALALLPILKAVHLPSSLRKIGFRAFAKQTFLKTVTGGKDLKIVEDYAFLLCGSLSEVKIESDLFFVAEKAFLGSPAAVFLDMNKLTNYTVYYRRCDE